jgi:hypothetical protein
MRESPSRQLVQIRKLAVSFPYSRLPSPALSYHLLPLLCPRNRCLEPTAADSEQFMCPMAASIRAHTERAIN